MINEKDLELFQGKYWKPAVGGQNFVTVDQWSIEMVSFQDKPPKPKLVLHIIELDTKPVDKVFQTGNRQLVQTLGPFILQVQRNKLSQLKLLITRNGEHDYRVSAL